LLLSLVISCYCCCCTAIIGMTLYDTGFVSSLVISSSWKPLSKCALMSAARRFDVTSKATSSLGSSGVVTIYRATGTGFGALPLKSDRNVLSGLLLLRRITTDSFAFLSRIYLCFGFSLIHSSKSIAQFWGSCRPLEVASSYWFFVRILDFPYSFFTL
jgi:hypothetical protein